MINNYIKIGIRNLLKHKSLTFINVMGLSIGLACFSLFMLYTVNEFNYNRFHTDHERIFRVYRDHGENGPSGDPYMPIPLGPALAADLPDVENFVRLREPWSENFVRHDGTVTNLGISFADPQIFDVLTFPLVYGDKVSALKELNHVVLTETTARRLFGEANPVGRTLEIKLADQFEPFVVAAVAADLPSNSTIKFELLANFNRLRSLPNMERRWTNWNHSAYETFVKLRPGSDLPNDPARLRQFRQKYYPNETAEFLKDNPGADPNNATTYRLQPIRDIHTQPMVTGGQVPPINPKSVWTLLAVAFGVLIIACINFTTLAIGRSAGRAREVGIRKVMGSNRQGLIGQFLTESMLLAVLSAGIGLLLAWAILPSFNQLADRELTFSFQQFPELSWLYAATVLLTGLTAGSYPALVLSGFKPVEILKNKFRLGGANLFTKSLVTGQFVLSVSLIIATLVILRQIDFMRSQNPGFEREQVVVVDAEGADSRRVFPIFKQEALHIPQVSGVAGSELGIGAGMGWSRSEWSHNDVKRMAYEYFVDPAFIPVLKLQLLAGRNFDPAVSADTVSAVIINETMMRNFGWTLETALGQPLLGYYEDPAQPIPTVIGVVKDFHFRPLKEAIGPQMFHQFSGYLPLKYFVRLQPGDPSPGLKSLQKAWASAEKELPFKYSFLDDDIDRFYKSEARLGSIIAWAGGISIFLACLGLFGLAALAVANRRREIGIRKVLGASLAGITALLARDFLKLVLVGIGIATPIAWYLMGQWLADFAYRIDLTWWFFAAAGLAAVAIAFVTVSVQSIKASLANPVNSLRSDQ